MVSTQSPEVKLNSRVESEILDDTFFRALFHLSNDGIMLLQNACFVICNDQALNLLGRTRDEVIGFTPWDISPVSQPDGRDSQTKASEYIQRGLKGERQIFDWVHSRSDGSPVDIEVSLSRITYKKENSLLCHLRDISQRKKMETALKQSESQFRRIVQDQLDFIIRWLPDGTCTFANESYCRFFNKSSEELTGHSFFSHVPAGQRQAIEDKIAALTPENPVAVDEHQIITPNCERRWHKWIDRAFFDAEGNIVELQSVGRDIHDQKMAEEALRLSEEKYSKAFCSSREAIVISRAKDGLIIETNTAFERISGFTIAEAIGRTTVDLGLWIEPGERNAIVQEIKKYGHASDVETKLKTKSGKVLDCLISADPIEINGEQCFVSVTRDITENKKFTDALEYQATHDALTRLHNRHWLKTRVDELIARQKKFALLVMDLDDFKEINDTLGHTTGDHILKQVSPKLKHILDNVNGDLVRLGGDEFAIILREVRSKEDVTLTAKEILQAFEQPFYFESMRLELSASLGISLFPEHGHDTQTLLRCADVAMYVSKGERRGFSFYQPEKDHYSTRRLVLMSELRNAIHDNQLRLYFQPKINLEKMQLIGFEALVRWQHPEHGLIPPAQFVPFAEVSESIHPLTHWVLENAIRECCKWHRLGHRIVVSVNLSTRNLLDQELSEKLEVLLQKYDLAPEYLECEITESALIKDPERVLKNLRRIHQTGVQLAIDDFGTGYSSMAYLKRMPLHVLKIDLSFVTHMLKQEQDEIIVKSTINLAHSLGLGVVAEGVENRATLDALRAYGCDVAQGYFIATPLPQAEVEHWINNWRGLA